MLHMDKVWHGDSALWIKWIRTSWFVHSVSTTSPIRAALTNHELPILRWRWWLYLPRRSILKTLRRKLR